MTERLAADALLLASRFQVEMATAAFRGSRSAIRVRLLLRSFLLFGMLKDIKDLATVAMPVSGLVSGVNGG